MNTLAIRSMRSFRAALPEWWPVLLGMVVLLAPTFYDLFTGPWVG